MNKRLRQVELDGLRLIGLGRVPRCARRPRYAGLVKHYVDSRSALPQLARVPADCAHRYCAPLAKRYNATAPQLALVDARVAS